MFFLRIENGEDPNFQDDQGYTSSRILSRTTAQSKKIHPGTTFMVTGGKEAGKEVEFGESTGEK
jgi:hypothetical protein